MSKKSNSPIRDIRKFYASYRKSKSGQHAIRKGGALAVAFERAFTEAA